MRAARARKDHAAAGSNSVIEFWDSLKEIAGERGMSVGAMIGAIDGGRKHANLSSAIRLFVLDVYRDQIASWGRH